MTARRGQYADAGLLRDMARYLRSRGASGYLVGGAVRDALTGRPSDNIDISVGNLRPRDLAGFLRRHHGFAKPVVFKRSNTVFTSDGIRQVEITPLRGNPARDALERDFTVNCLYVKLTAGFDGVSRRKVLDPTGRGLRDLRAKALVAYPDMFTPFADDPVRLLRAVRFRATLGFSVDSLLEEAISRMAYLISRTAPERVRAELEAILVSARVLSSFRFMQRVGLLEMILPEVALTAGFEQGTPYHAYDLLTHTLRATAFVEPDLCLRLAALLHDIGKVSAQRRKGRRMVYYGHEKISAGAARAIMKRLKFPSRLSNDVAFLIEHHMVNYSDAWTGAAVRRFMRKMGGRLDAVLSLAAADRRAHAPDVNIGTPVGEIRKRIARVAADMESRGVSFTPPLDGREIMEILDIGPGPEVGRAKEHLCQAVLGRGRPISREEAARLIVRWATSAAAGESE